MPRTIAGTFISALAVVAGSVIGLDAAMPAAVRAVDTITTREAPDLAGVRAQLEARDFKGALAALQGLVERGVEHADVYNLLGFAHRKSGNLNLARTYYGKALDFDANHKGALEYQGELYLETGRIEKARANLRRLITLCPDGCDEREDLEKAIAAAAKSQ